MRKRDKLFQRQKKSGKSKDGHLIKQVKHLIQIKIRLAYDNYLQDFFGSAAQNADENPSGFVSKKIILPDKECKERLTGNFTSLQQKRKHPYHRNRRKNHSFECTINISVGIFSSYLPPRLGQLCIKKVQELFENISENLKCKYPFMPEIKIDENGLLK